MAVPMNLDDTQTSRSRILWAGKTLFARHGYEQVSTAAIARSAGTSESQLVRYFGGKAGLLEAIFNESWGPLNERVERIVADATNAREAIVGIFSEMLNSFSKDPDLQFLFLFEERRIRGNGNEVILSKGFQDFTDSFQRVVRRGHKDGTFSEKLNDCALASALMAVTEGMLRDRLIAHRIGKPDPFTSEDIREMFSSVLEGLSLAPSKT